MSGSHATHPVQRTPWVRLLGVCVFAVAMAFVEAMVVCYLRDAVGPAEWRRVLDGARQLPGTYTSIEQAREAATLVMLAAVGYLAGTTWLRRLGYFLLAFGVWDIFYYVWLHLLSGFPRSLTSMDILFAIPSHWRAPVWVPTLIATGFVAAGAVLALGMPRARRTSRGAGSESPGDEAGGDGTAGSESGGVAADSLQAGTPAPGSR